MNRRSFIYSAAAGLVMVSASRSLTKGAQIVQPPPLTAPGVIGGRASSIKVVNMGGFVMRFHAQTALWESENSERFSLSQSAKVYPPAAFHGREMWPRALVDTRSGQVDPHDNTEHVICDRHSPATAKYEMKGTAFNPYFEWRGIENPTVPSPIPTATTDLDFFATHGALLKFAIARGLTSNRRLLSPDPSGNVGLWSVDDGSGRQQWKLEKVTPPRDEPRAFYYRIRISKGTNPGETYLSCTDTYLVDLFDRDDSSGHQWWKFLPATNGYYIQPYRPAFEYFPNYLSCAADGTAVGLWGEDDGSGRQVWKIES